MRKDAQLNRQRLIHAARECFQLRGANASLDEIALHAGVGRSTLFRNFADRLELVRAVSTLELDIVAEQAKSFETMQGGIFHLMRHLSKLSSVYRSLNVSLAAEGDGVAIIAGSTRRAAMLVAPFIERAKEDGLLNEGVSPEMVLMASDMMGAIFGAAFGLSEDESVEIGLRLLIEGLGKRTTASGT